MAERRKAKQKRKEEQLDKPTKEEYAVAKYLRFNLPPKEGKLVGMTVQYFVASKAVDMLMESQWSVTKAKADPLFTSKSSCVDYMHTLLEKGLFHRAARVEKKKDRDKKKRKGVKESEVDESGKEEDKKKKKSKKGKEKTKEEEKEKKEEGKKEEKPSKEEKDEENKENKEIKKDDEKKDEEKKKSKKDKKVRLEMHELQIFKDGDSEYYVWIYDPVPVKTFIIGLLLVLGAIAVCLFPLWPPEVRLGVYYLSLAAAGFVGVILALCVIRLVLFCIVWAVTFGKHHFWFLPNLTEDVGFFDSFKPLYKHDVFETSKEETSDKEEKKIEEEKSSEKRMIKSSGKDEEKSEDEEKEESGSEGENENDVDLENGENENAENGYEVIEKDELEDEEEDRVEDVEEDENSEDSQETKKDK